MGLSTNHYNAKQGNNSLGPWAGDSQHAKQFWVQNLLDAADEPYTPDKLIVTRNKQVITEFEINSKSSEIMVGSHSLANLQLSWPHIAPFHAKVFFQGGSYYLEDMGSEQGVYLNGKRMPPHSVKPVASDAIVRIMAFTISFSSDEKRSKKALLPKNEKVLERLSGGSASIINKSSGLSTSSQLLNFEQHKSADIWSDGTVNLTVARIIEETSQGKTFRLLAETPTAFCYKPGQYVTVTVPINGEQHSRCYSMSSSPSRPFSLDLTIKREPGGLVSNWLCDQVKQGDQLAVKKPAGRFTCVNSQENNVLFIGAGSGITPLMSMARWLIDTNSPHSAKLLVSFRQYDDIIFRSELELLSASQCNLDFGVTLTSDENLPNQWQGFSGRVDKTMLYRFAPDLIERDIYLCGPEGFMSSIKATLQEIGYPMHQLHCESFTPKKSISEGAVETAKNPQLSAACCSEHKITFARSNKTVTINEQTNILQAAESQGISVDYDCRSGSCGECMIKCSAGVVAMDDICEIDDIERQQGWIFSCCAFAKSDVELDL